MRAASTLRSPAGVPPARARLLGLGLLLAAGCSTELTLPPAPGNGSLSGRLLVAKPGAEAPVPAAGALVQLLQTNVRATSSETGRFTLAPITRSEGRVLVQFERRADGSYARQRIFSLSDQGVRTGIDVSVGDLLLRENATIRGRAVLQDKAQERTGHRGITVFVPEGPFTGYTGDDGSFTLPGLPEGDVTLAFYREGYTPITVGPVTLRPGELFTMGEVFLEPTEATAALVPVSGRVRCNPAVDDLTKAIVTAVGVSGERPLPVDAEGRFGDSLVPGVYAISYAYEGYGRVTVPNVFVPPPLAGEPQELLLAEVTLSPEQPEPPDPGPVVPPPTVLVSSRPYAATATRFVLDASSSFGPAGHPLVFTWRQLAGDPVTLERNGSQDAARTGFQAPATAQALVFELEVRDTVSARTGVAQTTVQVEPPPVATISAARSAATNATFVLDGSGSSSTHPLVYTWRQTRGEAVTLAPNESLDAARSSFTVPAQPQALAFRLIVRDSVTGLEASAEVEVEVDDAPTVRISSPPLARTGTVFTLDGSETRGPSGHALSFSWRQLEGVAAPLDRNDSTAAATTTFVGPGTPQRLVFELTVTDLDTDLARAAVTTIDFEEAPIAAIRSPRTAQAGARYELDGSGSRGPAGHPLSFSWRQTAGETVTLAENGSAAAARSSFVAPFLPQTVAFELTVTDTRTAFSEVATISIEFQVAPLAVARAPALVRAGATVQLDASQSVGPDGHELVFTWRQSQGDSVALSANDSGEAALTLFQAPARGQLLAFDLTVVDTVTQLHATASVLVEVQVPPRAIIAAPGVARAGGVFRLDGSASTSAMGSPLLYRWTQRGGDSVVLSDNDSALAAAPTFEVPPRQQLLSFELQVVDYATGFEDTASVAVLVLPPPRADISPPAIVVRPGARFRLDGAGSADPLGTPLISFRWSLLPADTDATLDSTTASSVLVTAGQSPFVVQLVVATSRLESDPTSVSVQLSPDAITDPTLVLSHGLLTVDTGATVTLTATASHPDPTEIVTLHWAQVSGAPTGLVVSAPEQGVSSAVLRAPDEYTTLVFDVTARASGGGVTTRSVTIEVVDRRPPRIVQSAPATANGAGPAFYAALTFDKELDPATLPAENVYVTDAGGARVAADLHYDPPTRTLRLSYHRPLTSGARYTLNLVGVRDRSPNHNELPEVHLPFAAAPPRWDLYQEASGASSQRPHPWILYTPQRVTVVSERVSAECAMPYGFLHALDVRKPGGLVRVEPGVCRGVEYRHGDFGPRAVVAGATQWAYSYNGPLYRRQGDDWVPAGGRCCQLGSDGTELLMAHEYYGTLVKVWNASAGQFGPEVRVDNSYCTAHRQSAGGDGQVLYVATVCGADYRLLRRDRSGTWTSPGAFGGPGRTDANFARVLVKDGLPVVVGEELVAGAWKVRAYKGVASGTSVAMQRFGADVNDGSVAQSDAAVVGRRLYVALAEGGLVRVRHADLDDATPVWREEPGPGGSYLNVNPSCQADRPSLAAAPDGLWLAWGENCSGSAPAWRVYVRQLTSGPAAPAFPPIAGSPRLTAPAPRAVDTGAAVTLDVAAVNPDATNALTFTWTQLSGGSVALATTQDAASTRATFTAPARFATLVFRVTATGERGGSDSALVTVEVLDRTAPRIATSEPAVANGAGPALAASITFDEPVDPATVDAANLRVLGEGGSHVPLTVRYDPGRRTATLTYARPLSPGSTYVLEITGVSDASPQANVIAPVSLPFTAAAPAWRLYAAPATATSAVSNRPWIGVTPTGPTIVADRVDTVACPTLPYGALFNLDVVEPDRLEIFDPQACRGVEHRHGDFGPRGVVAGGGVWAYSYNGPLYQRGATTWASAGSGCCQLASDGGSMYLLYSYYGLLLRAWNSGAGAFGPDVRVDGNYAWEAHRMTGGGDGRLFYVAGSSGTATSVARRDEFGNWARLGVAGGAGSADARFPRVRVFEGRPVIVQNELVGGAWRVRGYLGAPGSPWTFPRLGGSDANPSGSASQADAALVGSTLYVAWNAGGQLRLRSVDLRDPAAPWEDVSGPAGLSLNATPGCVADRPTLDADDGRLWLAWSESCEPATPRWRVYARSLR